eukprot:gene49919-59187_t
MSNDKRQRALEAFETDPEVVVFLLSIQVGAVGLNLTTANHIFIIDPPNNLTLERQAVARCWRMGQGREVHVRKFIAKDTIDEALLAAAQRQTSGDAQIDATHGVSLAAQPDAPDKGRGVALLAKQELIDHFGFRPNEVYDKDRDG